MAHFAKIENGKVVQVIVVHDSELLDSGVESEARGLAFLESLYGPGIEWKQCGLTGLLRKNYPGIGHDFDAARDAFIAPKPYASWALDEQTCKWKAPKAHPDDGKKYIWDEPTQSWVPQK